MRELLRNSITLQILNHTFSHKAMREYLRFLIWNNRIFVFLRCDNCGTFHCDCLCSIGRRWLGRMKLENKSCFSSIFRFISSTWPLWKFLLQTRHAHMMHKISLNQLQLSSSLQHFNLIIHGAWRLSLIVFWPLIKFEVIEEDGIEEKHFIATAQ